MKKKEIENIPIIEWQELIAICKDIFKEMLKRKDVESKFFNGIPAVPKENESIVRWVEFYRENAELEILEGTFAVRRGMKLTLFSLDYVTDSDKV